MTSNFLMTSGFNFEGYQIIAYYGVCSGESALGTGFLSSLGASVADLMGSNSQMYSQKLKQAKNFAIECLIKNAQNLGANAIIGLDIDYTSFSSDIMGVIANGTAVKIQPIRNATPTVSKILIANHNPELNFRPIALSVISYENDCSLQLNIADVPQCDAIRFISAVSADVMLITIFEEEYCFPNMGFINFTSNPNSKSKVSAEMICKIPREIVPLIKFGKVIIKKFIENNMLKIASDKDEPWFSSQLSEVTSTSVTSQTSFNIDDYILSISSLNSVKEIWEYTQNLNQTLDGMISPDLISVLEENIRFERMYGNFKDSCIRKVKEFFGIPL